MTPVQAEGKFIAGASQPVSMDIIVLRQLPAGFNPNRVAPFRRW